MAAALCDGAGTPASARRASAYWLLRAKRIARSMRSAGVCASATAQSRSTAMTTRIIQRAVDFAAMMVNVSESCGRFGGGTATAAQDAILHYFRTVFA